MTVSIKSLADGQLAAGTGTIYTTPASTQAIVKTITLVNTHDSALTVNLYFKASGGASRCIIPKDTSLAAGYLLVMDDEITLEAADILEGSGGTAEKVDFVISGAQEA
ncbi:unnamed protein product [marine sediment metagenome]|uniref:Uncharacterized protein n=1 Tax=marine sediment metagenome TaxID=412755 RepID=X1A6Q2_9ZZZZ